MHKTTESSMLPINEKTSRYHPLSLLYVDDEPVLLDLGKRFLERSSEFTVSTFPSAKEALNALYLQKFDAIVSDYEMPEINGITFLKIVRTKFGSIPFILFTGRGREEVVIEAINNGANYYLQKGGDPVSQFAELAHKIRQAVKIRETEEQVIESQKTLSDIINFLPDPIIVKDKAGKILAWNRANERTTGVSARDILGKDNFEYALVPYGKRRPLLLDLIDEPDETILTYYHNIRRTGDIITAESDSIQLQGKPFTPLVTACHLYNHSGEQTGSIEVIHDISDLKKVQQDLRKSEEHYRSIVNTHTDLILRFTPDMQMTFMNESCRSFLVSLMKFDDLALMNAYQVCSTFFPHYPDILSTLTFLHPVLEVEHRIDTPDNAQYWFFFSISALFDQTDLLYEYQMVARDITRCKEAERAVMEHEFTLRSFLEVSSDSIIIIDENGRIIEWNAQSERLIGLTKETVLNLPFENIYPMLHPALTQEHRIFDLVNQIRTSLITGDPMSGPPCVCELCTHTGRSITLQQVFFPMKAEKGFRVGLISQNITDRKKIDDEREGEDARLIQLTAHSSDLIGIFDTDMRLRYVSPLINEFLGYHPDEVIGKSIDFASHSVFSPSGARLFQAIELLKEGKPLERWGLVIQKKGGDLISVDLYATPIIRDERFSGAYVLVRMPMERNHLGIISSGQLPV